MASISSVEDVFTEFAKNSFLVDALKFSGRIISSF